MTAGVYAIINTATGRAYIGSSINIEDRWVVHRSNLRRGSTLAAEMVEAWQSLGPGGFEFVILESVEVTDDALEAAERRWMEQYAGRLYNTRQRARRVRADVVTLQRRLDQTLRRLERRHRQAPADPGGEG